MHDCASKEIQLSIESLHGLVSDTAECYHMLNGNPQPLVHRRARFFGKILFDSASTLATLILESSVRNFHNTSSE